MQRAAVNTEPALTRADLISELAASNSPLRIADAELIVVTIFDQIAAALARGERVVRGPAASQRPGRYGQYFSKHRRSADNISLQKNP